MQSSMLGILKLAALACMRIDRLDIYQSTESKLPTSSIYNSSQCELSTSRTFSQLDFLNFTKVGA